MQSQQTKPTINSPNRESKLQHKRERKMAKLITTLFTIALLLSFQLSLAARPDPAFTNNALKTQQQDKEAEAIAVEDGGEISCAGLEMEECLMRRTLAAHVDYIYTQRQKHKP